MKRILFGCVVALGLATMPLAKAQDCCFEPQFNPCCHGMDFNGFYVGGNVGVFSHTAHLIDASGFLLAVPTFTPGAPVGFTMQDTKVQGGVQVGYDWQCCAKVFGVVGDFNGTNAHKRTVFNTVAGLTATSRSRLHWFSTIRARAGLALSDALVYVTLGAAAARFRDRLNSALPAIDGFEINNHKDRHTRWGWVGGVGTELMLWCNWSIGAEVLFMHFNQRQKSRTITVGATTRVFRFYKSHSAWVARVLLNYRFGDLFAFGM